MAIAGVVIIPLHHSSSTAATRYDGRILGHCSCPAHIPIGQKKAFNPMKLAAASAARPSPRANAGFREVASSSAKEKVVTGLTALVLTTAMVIPDVAEAVQPEVLPSLKNFMLSILAGGVVLGVIVGAVIGVANFDPVKRS